MNSRITKKELGLLKGALRRVFSRSDLRRIALDAARIEHTDAKRPRVTKWGRCAVCKLPTPLYLMQVDHFIPIIPVNKTLLEMSFDEIINNLWCEPINLVPMCKPCHKIKTLSENRERRKNKNGK